MSKLASPNHEILHYTLTQYMYLYSTFQRDVLLITPLYLRKGKAEVTSYNVLSCPIFKGVMFWLAFSLFITQLQILSCFFLFSG